jgi:hypothetical protein
MFCPEFRARVAIDLPHGTTLYGRANGCVFGDPTSAHEHFVYTDTAIWADGTVKRFSADRAGKFWNVRPLTAAEIERERRESEFAMSLVD